MPTNENNYEAEDGGNQNYAESSGEQNSGSEESLSFNPSEEKAERLEKEPGGLEEKCAELEASLKDMSDQYLRKAADFENYRKRMNKEKQEITDFANQSLLLDILPMIDDFERALRSAETSRDFDSFYEGISMIEKRLSAELENKWGFKRFNSAGDPFDPNRHEALQMEKTPGITEPIVKEDYMKGYLLKDRVVRFAKVVVAMPEDDPCESADGQDKE